MKFGPCEFSAIPLTEVQFEGIINAVSGSALVVGGNTVLINSQTQIIGTPEVGRLAQVAAVRMPDGGLIAKMIMVLDATPTPTRTATRRPTSTPKPTDAYAGTDADRYAGADVNAYARTDADRHAGADVDRYARTDADRHAGANVNATPESTPTRLGAGTPGRHPVAVAGDGPGTSGTCESLSSMADIGAIMVSRNAPSRLEEIDSAASVARRTIPGRPCLLNAAGVAVAIDFEPAARRLDAGSPGAPGVLHFHPL